MEEVDVESECKNCNHAIGLHTPSCSKRYHEFAGERICGCKKPQYYGAVISDTNIGYTEFHCNKCGKLIGFLNSIDENIYEIIEDEVILCTNCIAVTSESRNNKVNTRLGAYTQCNVIVFRRKQACTQRIYLSDIINFYQ